MRILHISADYPDAIISAKTRAVANLLALADGHEHRVMSLNRVRWRAGIQALDFVDQAGSGHRAIAYGAPDKGLFLRRILEQVADWIRQDCAATGFIPDLVHAHKLSVEGLAGARLASFWDVPLALTIQGDSDLKIITARRDLRSVYAGIWRNAAIVFPFAPWKVQPLEARLGARHGPVRILPCPGSTDTLLAPCPAPAPIIRSAFNLSVWRRKNAASLIRALARAAEEISDIRLEIIGGGDAAAFSALASLANRTAPGRVRFLGARPNSEVPALLNSAAGFALVSRRETFGMVFAEALLAGAPCLIPRGRAIDGYFEDGSVVLTADPNDEAEIARGLVRLVREEAAFKARLGDLGARGGLDLLTRPAIRDSYLGALAEIGR